MMVVLISAVFASLVYGQKAVYDNYSFDFSAH